MEKKALTPVNESTLAENIINWETILSKLEKIFGKEIFDSWIKNIQLKKNSFIFHAGTKIVDNQLLSNGGRVLNITATGRTFSKIRKNIFKIIKKISWKDGFFRKDIGWRVI